MKRKEFIATLIGSIGVALGIKKYVQKDETLYLRGDSFQILPYKIVEYTEPYYVNYEYTGEWKQCDYPPNARIIGYDSKVTFTTTNGTITTVVNTSSDVSTIILNT